MIAFNTFFNVFIYFWLCWVFIAACGLSPVAVSGGYSLVAVLGILTSAVSLVAERAQAQGTQASVVAAPELYPERRLCSCCEGLSCPEAYGIFPHQG